MTTLNLVATNNRELHRSYSLHGKRNDPGRKLNPSPRPASAPSKQHWPDPFAAFEASVNGRTCYVRGYARADGRHVAGYWRRPRATWIGLVNPIASIAGTEYAPLLVG